MIGQPFEYYEPLTLGAATNLLERFGDDAIILGGGTMLIPAMSANQIRIANVIGLTALKLDWITLTQTHVSIGAMTTYAQLQASPVIAQSAPLLRRMSEVVTGGPSIWNQGTLGGSAAFANPASDAPACLVALQASFELHSVAGVRIVPASEFYLGAFRTARQNTELLVDIHIPLPLNPSVSHYDKHKSCASSWPIVTVASSIELATQAHLHIAVGGAAARPVHEHRIIEYIDLHPAAPWVDGVASDIVTSIGEGWSDELADGKYRRTIAAAAVRRNLRTAIERIKQ
jgi:carbon-monoxide dehydrogenase medium subunit